MRVEGVSGGILAPGNNALGIGIGIGPDGVDGAVLAGVEFDDDAVAVSAGLGLVVVVVAIEARRAAAPPRPLRAAAGGRPTRRRPVDAGGPGRRPTGKMRCGVVAAECSRYTAAVAALRGFLTPFTSNEDEEEAEDESESESESESEEEEEELLDDDFSSFSCFFVTARFADVAAGDFFGVADFLAETGVDGAVLAFFLGGGDAGDRFFSTFSFFSSSS